MPTVDEPKQLLLVLAEMPPTKSMAGSLRRICSTLTALVLSNVSEVTTVIGRALMASLVLMREPVTVTASTGASVLCADAAVVPAIANRMPMPRFLVKLGQKTVDFKIHFERWTISNPLDAVGDDSVK